MWCSLTLPQIWELTLVSATFVFLYSAWFSEAKGSLMVLSVTLIHSAPSYLTPDEF